LRGGKNDSIPQGEAPVRKRKHVRETQTQHHHEPRQLDYINPIVPPGRDAYERMMALREQDAHSK
jgi:hypothetical protein